MSPITAIALPVSLALLLGSAPSQQPVVQTVISNGTTATRYDMVILGDGYRDVEQNKFNQDVATFLTSLFQRQPYLTFAAYYNVHTVFRASVDSGADRPDEIPPVFVDTAYEATYNYGGVDRCLYIQNTSLALADAALAPANEGRILVLVNDTRYGGCAATFAVSYTGSAMSDVQAHELGHSLGQLADEYDYPYGTYNGNEPAAVNITKSPVGQKWAIWHGTDGISAFEGAGYYQYGLFRPRANCLMRSLGQILCRVCQENIVKITNSIAYVIDSASPAGTSINLSVPNQQQFAITHFVPPGNNPAITWRVDGVPVTGATGTSLTLDSTGIGVGTHTVVVEVHDQTQLVRSDPAGVMRETRGWQVLVTDPSAAQLRIPAFTTSALFAGRGATVTLTVTVANDGPAAAGPFAIEFFLSNTTTWSVQNTMLGSVAVTGLGPGQNAVFAVPVQLPWSLLPQVHYVHAVADRVDAVYESDETDNERILAFFGQGPACVTGLEFQDPLTPVGAATLSIAAGGTLHPTVVAPCVDPSAGLYLIAWTGSGTSPGVPLAPGLVLPLNPDPLTQIGLDNLNGPVFGSFLGLFDPGGIGRATFVLPPSIALPTGPTHFAAVLLGQSQLFTAASNPIQVTLVP